MNNIIKKVSAFAMAFTLLGTGTAIIHSFVPNFDNSITAYAIDQANQAFIENVGNAAKKNYEKYNILPSLTVAQAILESNWGKSKLAKDYYNFFGMKAGNNYTGETVTLNTKEEISGELVTVKCKFRVYHSFDEGIEGYYKFITGIPRYSNLIGETNYKEACRKIREDGWATDSSYTDKLISLIEKYNLTKYDCIVGDFIDVKPGDWFVDAVKFVYHNGIMSGTSSTTFSPLNTLTRGQFVTVLYNMKGRPYVAFDPNKFTDIKQSDYFASPVMWAVNNGITNGTGNRKFSPDNNITREQVAVMLYKYAKIMNYDTSVGSINLQQHFPDANKIDSWASDAMKWAVTNNIISGKATNSGTKLDPLGNTTRAECAQMIKNFVKKFGK